MLARNALLMLVVFEIAEFDFAAKRYRALNGVDVVEHRLVLALDATLDVHLLSQVFIHVFAAELSDAFDEGATLAFGKEFRRLHGIGQKQQLLLLEIARGQAIFDGRAIVLQNVVAKCTQTIDITIQGFTFDIHAELGELSDDLRRGKAVIVVGLTLENASQMQQLQFACDNFGHVRSNRQRPCFARNNYIPKKKMSVPCGVHIREDFRLRPFCFVSLPTRRRAHSLL